MRTDLLVAVAALAASATVFVTVGPPRLWSGERGAAGWGARRPPPGLRLLAPVPGAPGLGVRLALAGAVGGLVGLGGDPFGVPAPLAAVVAGGALFVASGRLRISGGPDAGAELASELPVICAQLAVCLEAGLPLRNAVAALGDGLTGAAAEAMRRVDAAVRLGVPEDEAWAELGERHPELSGLVRELRHASSAGVSLAPVLRQHARETRAATRSAAESRARRAGVSIVLPLVVCFLPAFLLVGVVPVVGGVMARLFG